MEKEILDEYSKLSENLSQINTRRGGSIDGLKGFYAEEVNATRSNIRRIQKGVKAREYVINNNGLADSVIKYHNGQIGREIQDKCGYNYYDYEKWLKTGKYDNMILRINKDNPIFTDEEQQRRLTEIAKQHRVKIEKANSSEREIKRLAQYAKVEGKARRIIKLSDKAPLTAKIYTVSCAADSYFEYGKQKFALDETMKVNQSGLDSTITDVLIGGEILGTNLAMAAWDGVKSTADTIGINNVAINTAQVIQGNKDIPEALIDTVVSTVKETLTAGMMNAGIQLGQTTLKVARDELKKNLGTAGAQKIVGDVVSDSFGAISDNLGDIVTISIQIGELVVQYLDGSITEKELVENVAKQSAIYLSIKSGRKLGKTVGSTMLPGVGAIAGEIIGGIVGYIVGTTIVSSISEYKYSLENISKKTIQANRMYNEALFVMKSNKEQLENALQLECDLWDEAINKAFTIIDKSTYTNNFEGISAGLNIIAELFNAEVPFVNVDQVRLAIDKKMSIEF